MTTYILTLVIKVDIYNLNSISNGILQNGIRLIVFFKFQFCNNSLFQREKETVFDKKKLYIVSPLLSLALHNST